MKLIAEAALSFKALVFKDSLRKTKNKIKSPPKCQLPWDRFNITFSIQTKLWYI